MIEYLVIQSGVEEFIDNSIVVIGNNTLPNVFMYKNNLFCFYIYV